MVRPITLYSENISPMRESPVNPIHIPFAGLAAAVGAIATTIFGTMTAGVGALFGVFTYLIKSALDCAIVAIFDKIPMHENTKKITTYALYVISMAGALALGALIISSMGYGLPFDVTFIFGLKTAAISAAALAGLTLLLEAIAASDCTGKKVTIKTH